MTEKLLKAGFEIRESGLEIKYIPRPRRLEEVL
jgi:hypothetical protein